MGTMATMATIESIATLQTVSEPSNLTKRVQVLKTGTGKRKMSDQDEKSSVDTSSQLHGSEIPAAKRKNRGGAPLGSANHQKHGLYGARIKELRKYGPRAIDMRSKLGKAVAEYRASLISDLGGEESLSKMELALVDEAIVTRLMLATVNEWLSYRKTLVDRKTRSIIPAALQRNAFVNTLQGLLRDLGLKRRAREVPTLAAYIASQSESKKEPYRAVTAPRDEESSSKNRSMQQL